MDQHTVGILIFDDVEVLDFAGPYEVFSRTRLEPGVDSRRTDDTAPFKVITVARDASPVTATGGLRVIPDHDFSDLPPIDILIVPGGFGTRDLLDDQAMLDWIEATSKSAQITASVCSGSLLFAKLGLLENRHATTHWGACELLASLDDSLTVHPEARVVMDEIVTSAGVAAGIDMAFALVERLHGKAVADETAHYIEYPRTDQNPFTPA